MERLNPQTTFALLVGIETYGLGDNASLDGPAAGACEIATWLRTRKVPASHIRMHLSISAKNKEKVSKCLTDLGITKYNANEDAIRNSAIQHLAKSPGQVLLIYWCGHGFFEDEIDRRLFCEDASQTDWRHVKFFDLLRYFRSSSTSFTKIIGFVDACAQFTGASHAEALPTYTFPKKVEKAAAKQFVLLSSSLGEFALNPALPRGPLFTDELMRELDKCHLEEQPDLRAIAANLETKFCQLRKQGKTAQTPSRYFHQDWDGGQTGIGTLLKSQPAPKATSWLGQSSLDALFAILSNEYLPNDTLLELYRNSLPGLAPPITDLSLNEIVGHLVELPTLTGSLHPLFQFVLQLSNRLPAAQQSLRTWLASETLDAAHLVDTGQKGSSRQRYFISVAVRHEEFPSAGPAGADAKLARRLASIRTWKEGDISPFEGGWDPDDPVTLEEVNKALVEQISRLESQLPVGAAGLGSVEIIIEFCLPRTLLAEPVDEWTVPDVFEERPLGAVYPVILRDRQRPRRLAAQAFWKERWDRLSQSPPVLADQVYWFTDRGGYDPQQQYDAIRKGNETHVCVGLGFEIDPACLEADKAHCLYGAWQAGLPAAIWVRKAGQAEIKSVLQKLLKGTLLHELPRRLWQLRQESYAASTDEAEDRAIRRTVSLVWDDPYRIPYDG